MSMNYETSNCDLIVSWLQRFGGSPWRFTDAMFKNLHVWKNLSIADIKCIFDQTKYSIICQYALIPFFAKYFGIDLRAMFLELARERNWDINKVEHTLKGFPEKFTSMHSSSITDYENYPETELTRKRIRQMLKSQNVETISQIEISDTGEILLFD